LSELLFDGGDKDFRKREKVSCKRKALTAIKHLMDGDFKLCAL
jgi:hypothetical protein